MKGLTRSQVAQKCGINVEALRYYERRQLIKAPPRSASGYRIYSEDYISRINFIRNSQNLGFTLKEIAELLKLRIQQKDKCNEAMDKARKKLDEVEKKMQGLKSLQKALKTLIKQCQNKTQSEVCPILASFVSKRT